LRNAVFTHTRDELVAPGSVPAATDTRADAGASLGSEVVVPVEKWLKTSQQREFFDRHPASFTSVESAFFA
jgi:hypothetical protein